MRKKVDSRIRTLVENCHKLKQRSMFVIVGDKGRDQVVNLHYMLSKTAVKARPSVLWCYKKDLYLSSHRKKRMRQIKKMMVRGLLDPEKEDPFSLFVASTNIRYCYYHDTHKILGNTFGMCVLQDFEALTPNLLARTIETVEGGGIIVLLLSSLTSLTQLYSLTMDVHLRFRTESHQQVTGRFNERLVLSLASNTNCMLMDDELNILPISSHVRDGMKPIPLKEDGTPDVPGSSEAAAELKELTQSLRDVQPAGSLVAKAKSLDQARAVVTFLDAASEKTLRATVALTAARGRGKSAALGLGIAGALGLGYSNIFVTAPSPENLRTLFDFIFKGLDALGYQEHIDYDLVESTNPAFQKAIVRVNVFRDHRQTVQYIQPQHHERLGQAELLVIDEAAAIPLPLVKAMLGPYLVFLCSTVNGYEGTGRSLSLKLLQQLRADGAKLSSREGEREQQGGASATGRTFREVQLQEPIRYGAGDKVEAWLNELLCLNASEHVPKPPPQLPQLEECELFYVERDTLFSFHKASEAFLQRMVALYVASHYRNTPNDLLLMADAPAHHLFVLLGPHDPTINAIPDILAVIQVALEGSVSKEAAMNTLALGQQPQGDMIPWTVSQQFQDSEFASLSGARIVRIAVHPDMTRAGYGSRALELLRRYYQGELADLEDDDDDAEKRGPGEPSTSGRPNGTAASNGAAGNLLEERIAPRGGLPPLLTNLGDRPPEALQYLGTSFGLTQTLFNFWRKGGYSPVYLRQNASDITGEHTVIMLRALQSAEVESGDWLDPFLTDFRCRYMALLPGPFRDFPPALVLSLLAPKLQWSEAETQESVQKGVEVTRADGSLLSPYDLKRLQAYSNNLVDHHLTLDLLPSLARAYFARRLPTTLSYGQAAILAVLGLQQRDVSTCEKELNLPSNQVLALFNKAVRKLHAHLRAAKEAAVERTLPQLLAPASMQPHAVDMDQELDDAAKEINEKMREALKPEDLAEFAIEGEDDRFAQAVGKGGPAAGALVSVKAGGGEKRKAAEQTPALYKKKQGQKGSKGGSKRPKMGRK
ncbi:RNA cytidine acetyltransferase [Coccomyxa sp. Obi]|nr:RNA cytidine acetyltransferase [Coccomyxa sp. Obi]